MNKRFPDGKSSLKSLIAAEGLDDVDPSIINPLSDILANPQSAPVNSPEYG